MGKRSRVKGASGELEVVHLYVDHQFIARRSVQQSQGGRHSEPDVVLERGPPLWTEVKRGNSQTPHSGLEQAEESCDRARHIPICFHRKDNGKWMVCMRPNFFFLLIKTMWPECQYRQEELPFASDNQESFNLSGGQTNSDGATASADRKCND